MKTDLKKPRYVLPLICLPFLFILFYVYKSSFGKSLPLIVGRDSLQTEVADVSQDVKNKGISNKLDAFRNSFKEADGYTAVARISEEDASKSKLATLYNERERQMLDSIDKAMKSRYSNSSITPNASPLSNLRTADYTQDRKLAEALSKINRRDNQTGPAEPVRPQSDPMALFRAQMALVDSIGKANDPEFREKAAKEKLIANSQAELLSKKKVTVTKALGNESAFNTISPEDNGTLITAMIDQNVTGFADSRIRIRLLDDIVAGKYIVKKGTYLFAVISGFSGQRVMLKIVSVFSNGNIIPIRLDVYDNDGMPGIYIPSSAFREFSRELGGSSSQGITLEQQAENNNQLVMGIIGKMFQSTTTAVNKLIRSNKAKLKYNSLVYLVDPDELKNKQKSY